MRLIATVLSFALIIFVFFNILCLGCQSAGKKIRSNSNVAKIIECEDYYSTEKDTDLTNYFGHLTGGGILSLGNSPTYVRYKKKCTVKPIGEEPKHGDKESIKGGYIDTGFDTYINPPLKSPVVTTESTTTPKKIMLDALDTIDSRTINPILKYKTSTNRPNTTEADIVMRYFQRMKYLKKLNRKKKCRHNLDMVKAEIDRIENIIIWERPQLLL